MHPTSVSFIPMSGGTVPTNVFMAPTSVSFIPTNGGTVPTSVSFIPKSGETFPTSGFMAPTSVWFIPKSGGTIPTSVFMTPENVSLIPTSGGTDPQFVFMTPIGSELHVQLRQDCQHAAAVLVGGGDDVFGEFRPLPSDGWVPGAAQTPSMLESSAPFQHPPLKIGFFINFKRFLLLSVST